MMHKKYYPDQGKVRRQGTQVSQAILHLVEIGVEVISVSFLGAQPLIEVKHCPGVDKMTGHLRGQGHDEHGRYTRKVCLLNNCTVEWNEARP